MCPNVCLIVLNSTSNVFLETLLQWRTLVADCVFHTATVQYRLFNVRHISLTLDRLGRHFFETTCISSWVGKCNVEYQCAICHFSKPCFNDWKKSHLGQLAVLLGLKRCSRLLDIMRLYLFASPYGFWAVKIRSPCGLVPAHILVDIYRMLCTDMWTLLPLTFCIVL